MAATVGIRDPCGPHSSEETGEGDIPVGSACVGGRACVLGQHGRACLIIRVGQGERQRRLREDRFRGRGRAARERNASFTGVDCRVQIELFGRKEAEAPKQLGVGG